MIQLCSRRTWALLLVFLLSVSVVGAVAQHAAKGNANGQEDVAVGSAGQQVAIDAKTGKFRAPTPEELQILTAPMANNQSSEGLVVKSGPYGSTFVDLQGRFENFSLAKIGSDGSIVTGCATTVKEATDFYKAEPKKATNKPVAKPASDPSTWEVK
jgi:hypothetical protein